MHRTIAHEIGHHLGLDHIGVILKTPQCVFAMVAASVGADHADPLTDGGTNSFYCYGGNQATAVNANIMGMGDKFTVENARPWLWAILSLRGYKREVGWQAVTRHPGTGSWARRSE